MRKQLFLLWQHLTAIANEGYSDIFALSEQTEDNYTRKGRDQNVIFHM